MQGQTVHSCQGQRQMNNKSLCNESGTATGKEGMVVRCRKKALQQFLYIDISRIVSMIL